MVVKPKLVNLREPDGFENSVILYGSQTQDKWVSVKVEFENSVILYGSQTYNNPLIEQGSV